MQSVLTPRVSDVGAERPHPRRVPLRSITGLRMLAALLVVCHHLAPLPASGWGALLLGHLLPNGMAAVEFFFVLSGFILTYTYWTGEALTTTRPIFWFARWSKIYPLYFLGFLLYAPAVFAYLHSYVVGFALLVRLALGAGTTLTMVQAWVPQLALLWNGPGWSLSDEAFFYLLFPIIVARARAAWLPWLWIASFLPGLAANWLTSGSITDAARVSAALELAVSFNPLLRLPEFVAGIILAKWFAKQGSRQPAAGGATLVAALALLAWLALAPPALMHVLLLPLCLALIGSAALLGGRRGVLGNAVMVRLGEASYATYILHIPIAALLAIAGFVPPIAQRFSAATFAMYLALLIPLSIAGWFLVEMPAQKRLRQWWHARAAAHPIISQAGEV